MKAVCFGAGIIGSSWCTNFALGGCEVFLYDAFEPALKKAEDSIRANLGYLVGEGVLTREQLSSTLARVHFCADAETALDGAAFVQESGPEKLEIKQSMARTIEQHAPADCVIASSTSGLRVSDIAAQAAHPERFIGAHPFNPPHLIPLVEITLGNKTQERFVSVAVEFYKSMKKEPIVLKKEKPGFVANRLSHAVLREVLSLVDEGVCTPEEADKALVYGPGLRWAAIGQTLVGELGSPGGYREAAIRFKELNESIFRDLENRTELSENCGEVFSQGAQALLCDMPDHIGHTREDVGRFRDKVLIELLKLHGKL